MEPRYFAIVSDEGDIKYIREFKTISQLRDFHQDRWPDITRLQLDEYGMKKV